MPDRPSGRNAEATGPLPALSYVLPLRWRDDAELADLTDYLTALPPQVHVLVVDGSPDEIFARHADAWAGTGIAHLRPRGSFASGKVNGVHTGIAAAPDELVVIADDDVRYTEAGLRAVADRLRAADLVVPQNHFAPLPWHAVWDSARTLLNRALGGDYPGTMGVRRSSFLDLGGYDGDVLFENLELVRTVRAGGGLVDRAHDVCVLRRPPTAAHFWSQRVRQAYDSFAQPGRLLAELSLLPVLLIGRRRAAAVLAGGSVLLAEVGRRRYGGRRHWPATASLAAPLWVAERAVCAWLAVGSRLRFGGVRYAGSVLSCAAHSERELRRRAKLRGASTGRLAAWDAPATPSAPLL